MSEKNHPKSGMSLTLLNAITVLDVLASADAPLSLSSIARQASLNTTVTHRLVTTFRSRGMVVQEQETKRYSLGWRMVNYGGRVLATVPYSRAVSPWLERLRDATEETATLHVPNGDDRVCVLECESKADLRRSVGVGRRAPLNRGASGRAILAFLPDAQRQQILSGLPAREAGRLARLLSATQRDGYAMSHGETTAEVSSLAVPLLDRSGSILGSLSISGPSFRWTEERMVTFIPALRKAVEAVQAAV